MCVVKQSVHEVSMAWHVAEAVRDISGTVNSMTSFKRAQVPAVKELPGLSRDDGWRPDGVTLLPWAKGKPLAWDVTVPDTYADSYLADTATTAGAASDKAASNKEAKYRQLANTHIFVPVAMRQPGPGTTEQWNWCRSWADE